MLMITYTNLRLIFTLPLTAAGDEKILDNIKRSWELTETSKKRKRHFRKSLFIFR